MTSPAFAREQRILEALDAGDIGVWEWSIASGNVAWSPTLERIHGFEPGAFGGTFEIYSAHIHEDDRPRILDSIRRAVEQGNDYEVEYRMYRPDRSLHWVAARGRVFRDAAGRPEMMIGTCMDVTDRRRAMEGVQLLANVSSTLSASLDYEKTLRALAALVVPALADRCVVDVLDDEGTLKRLAVSDCDGLPGSEDVIRTGTGELLSDRMCVPLNARGRTLGAITFLSAESRRRYDYAAFALAQQLAERAAIAIDNARLYQKSVEASRAKDEFLATLSHELRTPMTAVLGYADLIARGDITGDDVGNAVQAIRSAARTQARLIEDILDVSSALVGKFRFEMSPTNLAAAMQAAVESVRPAATARQIALHARTDDAECLVLGDPTRLQQIVWNLLSNAIKFTLPGGAVSVTVARDDSDAILEVRDTGVGVAAEFLPRMFDRFQQADSARQRGGLGLGLAIVRHLTELHGGSVEASSEGEGKGATFTVRLPLLRTEPAALHEPAVGLHT